MEGGEWTKILNGHNLFTGTKLFCLSITPILKLYFLPNPNSPPTTPNNVKIARNPFLKLTLTLTV